MTVDYQKLREENTRRYGTDIGRIGRMLLADRYDKRTHFIFELLQNAEDALRRRRNWQGSRSVAFALSPKELTITHCGEPFNERDVRGVCGIDESTKDITSIGRFGIGFKSVYAFTKRPEIHSGSEAFAIDDYVLPVSVASRPRNPDKTIIVLPLAEDDVEAQAEILEGLQDLGARTLLFLRNVKEISWSVYGGASGLYFRNDPIERGEGARELYLMGQQGKDEVEEKWLVFSKEVQNEGQVVGSAEIAFSLESGGKKDPEERISALDDATLSVFFPTVLPTHTGFLIQGPYRTTPSRDNVPPNDRWNKQLVVETGELVVEALRWLCKKKLLDANTLKCLPLESGKFSSGLFEALFNRIKEALKVEALLPCSDGSYASAERVQLSRTQDLRDLFTPDQLGALLEADEPVKWLSPDITADRTPALRQYLLHELELSEQTPELLLVRLDARFLEAQPDDWIVKLYEFLTKVPAAADRLEGGPLVRLENGSHVPAFVMGQPQAFLPTDTATEFPTVRLSVCGQPQARRFLESLNLTEPDPVDDVIRNLLPKYQSKEANPKSYAADIARILNAFKTDSAIQQQKLIKSLKATRFVMARNTRNNSAQLQFPEQVYLATARLKELFDGVRGVDIVDDTLEFLRGEDMRDLLEACGSTRYIVPIELSHGLSDEEKHQLRRNSGYLQATYERPIVDYGLRGLSSLLRQLPGLSPKAQTRKALLLWEALAELEDRRGHGVFTGNYRWKYHEWRSASFDAGFIRTLNRSAWIPDGSGVLRTPGELLFKNLQWPQNAFLLSKIQFKKPVVEELAREAGIEPGVLDVLKKFGLTNTADLMARLNVEDLTEKPSAEEAESAAVKSEESPQSSSTEDAGSNESYGEEGEGENNSATPQESNAASPVDLSEVKNNGESGGQGGATANGAGKPSSRTSSKSPAENGERKFVSYVAAHPEQEDDGDGDESDQAERLALETQAIQLIRSREPLLVAMPAGNPGFDLLETDANDEPERWVEVKAMKGSLEDRPVGLSSVQFEFARRHGDQFWLYVVEFAGDPSRARIIKIQNPAGRAGTFTFDKGWVSVAFVEGPSE